ncbi:hypothetical protein D3C72_1207120 [compost metagenome]
MADEFIRGRPRRFGGFAHDDVQSDPEAHAAAMARGTFAHIGDFPGDGVGRFAPGQVHVELFGREFMRCLGRAAEVQRRIGFLDRRIDHLAALGHKLLALEAEAFGLVAVFEDAAPDLQVIGCDGVALVVADEDAVAFELARIAAGDHVDQQASFGQPVESGGHAGGDLRRADAGADRDEEF